ncbi:IRF tryptophan pentad repeat domain-containing protein, partial [Nephila pilipes]
RLVVLTIAKMGRKGSLLVLFLRDSLIHDKYKNLKYTDESKSSFILDLPQKTRRLKKEDEIIFQDWYKLKGRKYNFSQDYSKAKQTLEASLKKSEYLKRIKMERCKLCYRFLKNEEVEEYKKKKKSSKDSESKCQDTESGYESAPSPSSSTKITPKINSNMLRAIKHDHSFCSSTSVVTFTPREKSHSAQHIASYEHSIDPSCLNYGMFLTDEHVMTLYEDFYIENEKKGSFLSNDNGEVTLQKLEEIPLNELFMPNFDCRNLFKEVDQAENGILIHKDKLKKQIVYVCNKYEYIGSVPVLFCERKEIMAEIEMDYTNEQKIIFDEEVLQIWKSCRGIKDIYYVDKNMLIMLEV